MVSQPIEAALIVEATTGLVAWAEKVQRQAASPFEAARRLATRLGAHYHQNGLVQVGFWTPELAEDDIPTDCIFLELLRPLTTIDFNADQQEVAFQRRRIPL